MGPKSWLTVAQGGDQMGSEDLFSCFMGTYYTNLINQSVLLFYFFNVSLVSHLSLLVRHHDALPYRPAIIRTPLVETSMMRNNRHARRRE